MNKKPSIKSQKPKGGVSPKIVPDRQPGQYPSTGFDPGTITNPPIVENIPQFFQNPHKNFSYWYKGAAHAHSNLSDGGSAPLDVIRAHREKGYRFIFLTDHNKPSPQQMEVVDGILFFRSHRSFECGQKFSHHILVLGIDPTCIGSYPRQNEVDPDRNGTVAFDTGDPANLTARLGYYEHIGMAVIAHPHLEHHDSVAFQLDVIPGAGWELNELLNFRQYMYTGIEIFNSSEAGVKAWYEGVWGDQSPGRLKQPFAVDWWDEALKRGPGIWGFANDDSHWPGGNNGTSFNRGWIVVNSARPFENSIEMERDIINNIKRGNFYSVVRRPEARVTLTELGPADNGPELHIVCWGPALMVNTDRVSDIAFHICSDSGVMRMEFVAGVKSVIFTNVTPQDKYVRVVVHQIRDCEHYQVFSQPVYVIKANPT